MNEFVSIITPSYNCKEYFSKTFESVINQTFKEFEWIIIDDCSTDGSYEYICSLIKNDKRIQLFKNNKNHGPAYSRNIGLDKAKGRYITFLDSDDSLDNNYLECQMLFIKENGPLISSGYRRKGKSTSTDFYVPNKVDYKLDLNGNPLSCLTTMYDRKVIGEERFLIDNDIVEDYAFWLNILRKGIVAKGNPKILATYNVHEGSKSRNKKRLIKEMFNVYHKTQKLSFIRSAYHLFKWAIYGTKKYRNVK